MNTKKFIIIGILVLLFVPSAYVFASNMYRDILYNEMVSNSREYNNVLLEIEDKEKEIEELEKKLTRFNKRNNAIRGLFCTDGEAEYCPEETTEELTELSQSGAALLSYKTIRLREMRDIIWAEYNDLFKHNEILLAHIYHECGSLTKDCDYKEGEARNDYGYGYGIMQHNIHIRSADWFKKNKFVYRPSNPAYTTTVRNKFVADHKWAQTWRGQWRKYLDIQSGCMEKYKSITTCVRKHNWAAGYTYYALVKSKVYAIRTIIG